MKVETLSHHRGVGRLARRALLSLLVATACILTGDRPQQAHHAGFPALCCVGGFWVDADTPVPVLPSDPDPAGAPVRASCREVVERNLVERRANRRACFRCTVDPAVGSTALSAGYRVLTAMDGDPSRGPARQAVRAEHFNGRVPTRGEPPHGPRVAVELPGELRGQPLPPDAIVSVSTAFVWACRVIDAAERWAGHRIDWGTGGTLVIRVFAGGRHRRENSYSTAERVVELGTTRRFGEPMRPNGARTAAYRLDAASVPDVVAHEAGHAAFFALKPGWSCGTALVLAEALADTTAFLVAAGDWDVASRAAQETSGDYHKENEVCRLGESTEPWDPAPTLSTESHIIRSARSALRLSDLGLEASATAPSLWPTAAGESADPHRIGQVVSGALYEVFAEAHRAAVAAGTDHLLSSCLAAEIVGTVMLRALPYVGEHRVSFHDYAQALLRAEAAIFGSRYRSLFTRALTRRGLLAEDGCNHRVSPQADPPQAHAELFLDPVVTEPAAVLTRISNIEGNLVSILQHQHVVAPLRRGAARNAPLRVPAPVYHECVHPFRELVDSDRIRLYSDSRSTGGPRVVRISFPVSRLVPLEAGRIDPRRREVAPGDLVERVFQVYAGLVFDRTGHLVETHADRPWGD